MIKFQYSASLVFTALMIASGPADAIQKCVDAEGKVTFRDPKCPATDSYRKKVDIKDEKDHLTFRETIVIDNDGRGRQRIDRTVVYPDPDARPGLRAGEERMLRKIEAEERRRDYYRRRDYEREQYSGDSYSEQLERRNLRVEQHARERRW